MSERSEHGPSGPGSGGTGEPSDHRDTVRESFRRQVGMFTGPDSPFARRSFGPLGWLEPLGPDMVVLEVACGAAHVTESIAPSVRCVVGIDLTPELLALGAGRLRDAGIGNVVLQEGDAEALPFVDASFDLVCCRAALHHMADPARAVAEMARVCRPGRRVALSDLIVPSADVREVFDHVHRLLDPSHVRTYLESELADVLPAGVALSHGETSTARFPVDIAVTAQSDAAAVYDLLRAEIAGGSRTGLEPTEEDGKVVVAFATCAIEGTLPAASA